MEYEYVKMLPWVGERYAEAAQRVMVVGVKIYSPDPGAVSEDVTTELVEYYLRYHDDKDYADGYFATYDRTIDIIRDEGETREAAWQRIIFYNFTQEPLQKAASFPDEEQLEYGRKAFDEIIKIYHPDKILVMGKKLHDRIVSRIGERAQNFAELTSWVVDIPDSDQTAHLIHFNDTSYKNFDLERWRQTTRQFLDSVPEAYKDPQNRRHIGQILKYLQVDSNAFVISNKYTLLDVLSRAVNNGILHLHPDFAIAEEQRIKGSNTIATAYFAKCLRDKLYSKDSSRDTVRNTANIIEQLLTVDDFEVSFDEEKNCISFTGKKKSKTHELFNTIKKFRQPSRRKHIEWKVLEALFDTSNLRQYSPDIRKEKNYIKRIDKFFSDKNW